MVWRSMATPLVGTAYDRLCETERPCLRLCPPYKRVPASALKEGARVRS